MTDQRSTVEFDARAQLERIHAQTGIGIPPETTREPVAAPPPEPPSAPAGGRATDGPTEPPREHFTAAELRDRQIAEREARESAIEMQLQAERVEAAVERAAVAAGATYPATIERFVDLAEVLYDADGQPANVDELVAALKAAQPGLFAGPATPATSRPTAVGRFDATQQLARIATEVGIR